VTGKPVFISYARGGEYPPGSLTEPFDFQTKYLEGWLSFIGFTDIRKLAIETPLGSPELVDQKRAASIEKAREMALTFSSKGAYPGWVPMEATPKTGDRQARRCPLFIPRTLTPLK
jgi:hypothetical protein